MAVNGGSEPSQVSQISECFWAPDNRRGFDNPVFKVAVLLALVSPKIITSIVAFELRCFRDLFKGFKAFHFKVYMCSFHLHLC